MTGRRARRPDLRNRGRRLLAAAAVTAAVTAAAAACVRVDPAPNGIASVRLDATPPAVALGDSLRDTLGVALRVHGVAYDVAGNVVPTATFWYSYLPTTPDTAAGATIDTALVVDSATGAVRATGAWLKLGNGTGISSGRVLARIGSTLQLADTLQIVPPPDSVVATAPTDTTLRYDCRDDGAVLIQSDSILKFRNTAGPFAVTVRGDSVGKRVFVRRWLVRWSVDSAPKVPIPTVKLPTDSTKRVPAIAIIANGSDQIIGYDTTAATGGVSNVRLRLRPIALGPSYVADTTFRVVLRADVIVGHGTPVRGSPVRVAVRLHRVPNVTCPQ